MQPEFRPLDGIKVIDVSHVIAGPFATWQLAQLGADVLKVESAAGDVMRSRGQKAFTALNSGKRKTRLDINSEPDRERLRALAADADVFVDNLRPGVLEARGLGATALMGASPRLIYCAISGFGQASAGRPAYDHVVQAATGMTLATGSAGEPPTKIGFPLIDAAAGMIAALAVVSALRERDRIGRGMLLDVSMAAAGLQLMYPAACEALTDGREPERLGNQASSGSPASNVFATRDGGHIAIAANTPRQFVALLDVIGLPDLAGDPACFETPVLASSPAGFLKARDAGRVRDVIATRLAAMDAADIEARLMTAKVPVSRVRSLASFAREAMASGALGVRILEEDGVRVVSPGLGFQVRHP